jgi:hypothetical protein
MGVFEFAVVQLRRVRLLSAMGVALLIDLVSFVGIEPRILHDTLSSNGERRLRGRVPTKMKRPPR